MRAMQLSDRTLTAGSCRTRKMKTVIMDNGLLPLRRGC